MRQTILIVLLFTTISSFAQKERDTTFKRCPVFITDTSSSNNFFIEGLPATMKVDRVGGDLVVTVQQKDQFFTIFFRDRRLKNTKYKLKVNPGGRDAAAKYSFRSGDQVSYVNVSSGNIESAFDKEKNLWHVKVNGMIANMVERSVTYYRVKADLWLK
jgi:hypothetical protein